MSDSPLVFITGASSGIGQALAARYANAGWRLALVARRVDEVRAWADAQRLPPARVGIYRADVADPASVAAAADDCIARQGLPVAVIANAGISIGVDPGEAADMPVLRELLLTNTLGVAATFQPFLKPMAQRGSGTLVGIASVAAIRGLPGHGGYSASKAGVIAYCESMRADCRRQGVKVVTLLPGYIATPLTARNRYRMPFLMSAEDFADQAFRAIGAGVTWCVIPWQMRGVALLLRLLPDRWYDRLMSRRGRKARRTG